MQVFNCIHKLCEVKYFVFIPHPLQYILLKLSSPTVLQCQVQLAAALEGTRTTYNPRVFHASNQFLLDKGNVLTFHLLEPVFAHLLQSELLPISRCLENEPEGTLPKHPFNLEISQSEAHFTATPQAILTHIM